jgi:leader peptidase (prepilin peptidase)/N-methyltransferase
MIACTLHPSLMGQHTALQGFSWSLASAVIGALVLLGVAWIGTILFKKESMGMGDVKFLAAICSFLGSFSILWVLPVASLIGSVLGVALIVWQRGAWGTRIPFGPFLGLAVVAWFFGGADVLAAWWHNTGHILNISTGPMIDARSIPSGP